MALLPVLATIVCLTGLRSVAAQGSKSDAMFTYTQVMANCVGQQFIDQNLERLVTAVRRCEQAQPQPLRDRALETVINNLQGDGIRVVYVPVAVGGGVPGFGTSFGNNFGGAGRFPLNTLGTGSFSPSLNPALNTGFNNPSLTGLTGLNQLGFNRVDNNRNRDSTLGSNFNSNSNTRTNNPFGFNFGKQTTQDVNIQLSDSDKSQKSLSGSETETQSLERKKRQLNNDARTRIEALNYLSNMTCVMREAGMIDHNNLPNYQFFENELRRQQVGRDLRNDIANGLFFCKDLTQCMSVDRLSHPLARELGQATAYLRCIARTNVKACKKQEERRSKGNARLTGAFNFFNGNGMDLLESITELAFADDSLGFDFF